MQALALDTIPKLYERQSTIEYMKVNAATIYSGLWEKIADQNKNVRQLALQNFVWLSQAQGSQGYVYLMKAAKNFAQRENRSPFTELVNSLNKKWDIDLRYLALQLLNCLIVKCPEERLLAAFLARLESIGLYDELR